MRINLGEAKEEIARIPEVNMCSADERMVPLINRAIERIVEESRGSILHQKIRMCVYDNMITTPPGVASMTDFAICDTAVPMRSEWYEMLPDKGDVYIGQNSGTISVHDRGEACTFSDIIGSKKLKIYLSIEEDAGVYCYALGHDEHQRPLRTTHGLSGGVYKDGEKVHIGGTGPFLTTNLFTSLTHFQKPRTRGRVLIYEYDTSTTAERPIATYEHFETLPSYRRYLVRGIPTCSGCSPLTVTAMAKLEYIPASDDNDLLIVPSMEAIRMMCKAIIKLDNSDERAGLALSSESMRRLGMHRDHVSPIERTAVVVRSVPRSATRRKRVGMLR